MADKPFQMPPIEVGRVVNWYKDGHRTTPPQAALVTQATPSRVAVATFPAGVKQHAAYDGVMHVDDPRAKQGYAADSGAWDYTDFDKRMMDMLDSLESPKSPLKKAS